MIDRIEQRRPAVVAGGARTALGQQRGRNGIDLGGRFDLARNLDAHQSMPRIEPGRIPQAQIPAGDRIAAGAFVHAERGRPMRFRHAIELGGVRTGQVVARERLHQPDRLPACLPASGRRARSSRRNPHEARAPAVVDPLFMLGARIHGDRVDALLHEGIVIERFDTGIAQRIADLDPLLLQHRAQTANLGIAARSRGKIQIAWKSIVSAQTLPSPCGSRSSTAAAQIDSTTGKVVPTKRGMVRCAPSRKYLIGMVSVRSTDRTMRL